jgi:hypothetical protein
MTGRMETPEGPPAQRERLRSRRSAFFLGLAATVVGVVQVGTTLVGVGRTHLVTVIAALRFYFCGSLLVVGALVLGNLWRARGNIR